MPCLHSEALESMEPGSVSPGASPDAGAESMRRGIVSDSPMVQGTGWFFSPLWSPRSRLHSRKFGDGTTSYQEDAWLDDHSDFTRAYFLRRTSAVSCPQTEMSPLLSRFQRRSSDHSEALMKAPYRRNSSPLRSSDLNVLTLTDRRLASNLSVPEWMDHFGPDVKESHSPCCLCLPRCSRFQFSPCQPRAPVCPCSSSLPHPPQFFPPTSCGHGDGCPWMMGLLGEGLSCMGSLAELCQGTVIHVGELLGAEGGSLSLVRKHCGGRSSLEDVIALTSLGHLNEGNPYSQAHLELVKGIMGCVMATASPINLRDASEDPRFNLANDQTSKIRTVLSVPISNHRGEVCVPLQIPLTNVLSNHMDVLGTVLDNVQLYEGARQEAKRSKVKPENSLKSFYEHHSLEVMLSKMAATIMPFTHAQYCTIFIPSEQTSDTEEKVHYLDILEHDLRNIDPSCAFRTLTSMETLNMSKSSDELKRSLICCPVRNERSENVIAVCQLMNKQSRASDEMEVFNRYDERLLEDLAVYCGLALQYAQAVQITEERRASIEVTQEVLAYHITAAEQEIQALQEATIPSAELLNILDFHFSGFGVPEDATTQSTIRMFLDLNLVQDFNIDYKVSLCQWVLTVKRGYRNNVPYHNWHHAVSTAQSMFAMLMATDQLQTIFSRLEILALMIATLNHDVDHRGVNNSFIERTHQPLAQLYGHSSLENHHYNLCVFILNNTGSQILSGLSAEEHKALLHLIKRAILATDLTVYMERRKEFFSLANKSGVSWKSEKQRDLLRSMLMTASDLSAITKPWPEQKRIASLVAMEFFAQGDKEREEFKIKPIDIMNRENSTRLPYMQVEYIDEVCYPLYKTVSRLFDSCSPLLNGCKKNRENWLQLADEQEKENNENFTA
uniref:Phosphodiesterase n=1 Tax=Astatotilapia calliptera TaxID=8154 RepID=A0AAX7UIE7_ASTCA